MKGLGHLTTMALLLAALSPLPTLAQERIAPEGRDVDAYMEDRFAEAAAGFERSIAQCEGESGTAATCAELYILRTFAARQLDDTAARSANIDKLQALDEAGLLRANERAIFLQEKTWFAMAQGDAQAADQAARDWIVLAREIGERDYTNLSRALAAAANIAFEQRDIERGIALRRETVALADRQSEYPQDPFYVRYEFAKSLYYAERLAEADSIFAEAQTHGEALPNPPLQELVQIHAYRSIALLALTRSDASAQQFDALVALAEAQRDTLDDYAVTRLLTEGRQLLSRDEAALGLIRTRTIALKRALGASMALDLQFRARDLARAGDYDEAIATYRDAIEAHRADGNAYLARSTGIQLAMAYRDAGRLDEAEDAFRTAIAEDDEPVTAYELEQLGQIRQAGGDYAGASESYREALELRSAGAPPCSPEKAADNDCGVQFSLELLADLHAEAGNWIAAEPYQRKLIAHWEDYANEAEAESTQRLGRSKARDWRLRLVTTLARLGRFDESVALIDAIEPRDSAQKLRVARAELLDLMSENAGASAIPVLREELALAQTAFDEAGDWQRLVRAQKSLAFALQRQSLAGEAEALARDALALLLANAKALDLDAADTIDSVLTLLGSSAGPRETVTLTLRLMELRVAAFGLDDARTVETQIDLSRALERAGLRDQAAQGIAIARDAIARGVSNGSVRHAALLARLSPDELGPDPAAILELTLGMLRSAGGPGSPVETALTFQLGALAYENGDFDRALDYTGAVYRTVRDTASPASNALIAPISLYARSAQALGRDELARTLLRQGVEGLAARLARGGEYDAAARRDVENSRSIATGLVESNWRLAQQPGG